LEEQKRLFERVQSTKDLEEQKNLFERIKYEGFRRTEEIV
jgi:hypothetical protein